MYLGEGWYSLELLSHNTFHLDSGCICTLQPARLQFSPEIQTGVPERFSLVSREEVEGEIGRQQGDGETKEIQMTFKPCEN